MNRFLVLFCAVDALATISRADGAGIDASRCLTTQMHVSQEIGNVFSRTISFRVDGYDDFVRRVSGTASYKVVDVSPEQFGLESHILYDGRPAELGKTIIKNGGRTLGWNGRDAPATDASGVSINPLLWGEPKGILHVGDTWQVHIAVPWELGPAGQQVVRVIAIDALNDGITLERQGEGEGEFADDIKSLPLVKDKRTYTVDLIGGKARWSGYTRIERGVIVSDALIVVRPITVTSKELGQSTGTERQYILLNATPVLLLSGTK